MLPKNVSARVAELAEPVCGQYGCELWDVEFKKEGANWFLRIFIDKPGGVGIDDCEKVSRVMDKLLDEYDLIENSYFLEVSSPGIERELRTEKHLQRYLGAEVEIKLYKPVEGARTLTGKLVSYGGDAVVVETPDGEKREIRRAAAAYVRLAAKF